MITFHIHKCYMFNLQKHTYVNTHTPPQLVVNILLCLFSTYHCVFMKGNWITVFINLPVGSSSCSSNMLLQMSVIVTYFKWTPAVNSSKSICELKAVFLHLQNSSKNRLIETGIYCKSNIQLQLYCITSTFIKLFSKHHFTFVNILGMSIISYILCIW